MYKHIWHVAPDSADHYLVAPCYEHGAPHEQRQVSPVCVNAVVMVYSKITRPLLGASI